MVYGKGFASAVVMGGMWSLSRFTIEIILCAAFSSDLVMARRTFSTSVCFGQYMVPTQRHVLATYQSRSVAAQA
jgi:hypothetical protein